MVNECTFCEQRHIDTSMLILNDGNMWIEFCEPCGEEQTLTNDETGETVTVKELFDRVTT